MAVPFQVPVAMVPTDVKDELTTELPRVVAVRTSVPATLNDFPVATDSPDDDSR